MKPALCDNITDHWRWW